MLIIIALFVVSVLCFLLAKKKGLIQMLPEWREKKIGLLTRRCRLYRAYPSWDLDPKGGFVELWDFLEEPYETKKDKAPSRESLPPGDLVFAMSDPDAQVVRRALDEFRGGNNIILSPSWSYTGM